MSLHTKVWQVLFMLKNSHDCKINLRYWNSSIYKTLVGDFEGHQLNSRLTQFILFPDSIEMRYRLLWWLHIHHWTIQIVLTVQYALAPIPTYPTHSDKYSLPIRLNIFQSFIYFVRFCLQRQRPFTNDKFWINYACIMFLLLCGSDVNVILKTFSITWQIFPDMI